MPDATVVYASGILAETGDYGARLALDALYEAILEAPAAAPLPPAVLRTLGPPADLDASDLREARWGILWPPPPLTLREAAHRDALQPLFAHRRQQLGGAAVREFAYDPAWGDLYDAFLWSAGPQVERGQMRPEKIPYYLCLVGSPERIPWRFQQELDSEYAAGRLWFDDSDDCRRYVQQLLAYETAQDPAPAGRKALFLGTRHPGDPATERSAADLVQPLYAEVAARQDVHQFDCALLLGDGPPGAHKTALLQRLASGATRPALLFTAGHGAEYPPSAVQHEQQGALLFQEWNGGPAQPAHYLSADQVGPAMDLSGSIAFCFACFSAGTPLEEDWVKPALFNRPRQIAARPFVARLPQKLLARGLLGFIGHVSRAWTYSFLGVGHASQQYVPFRSTLVQLLRGRPIGHATDDLNRQALQLAGLLQQQVHNKQQYSKAQTTATWLARNDFLGYVLLGDPAARLRVEALDP